MYTVSMLWFSDSKNLNNIFNSLLNYHVTLNIMSCDLGGHDHTPERLVISILKFTRVRDYMYINIVFFINCNRYLY